jgi:hypothetical protein
MKLSDKYKPTEHFYRVVFKSYIWGSIGILLGILTNNSVVLLSTLFNIKALLIQNIIQLFLCSFILALTHVVFSYFAWSWQNITPGLFFVSFFFGVQFNILTNIQNRYITTVKI